MAAFEFTRNGRTPRTLAIVIAIYTVLIAGVILVDAARWLMGVLALLTLPALWDLWRDPSAGVFLKDDRLDWHSGRRSASLALQEIDYMHFATRWDFTTRVTAVLHTGKRIRLPYEALPPHRAFEKALVSNGVKVENHPFSVF